MNTLSNNKGRFMTITYKEMRERALGIQAENDKRIEFLKSGIKKLLSDYVASLELESGTWKNIDGREREYVDVYLNRNEEFIPFQFDDITTYYTTIAFATVVNDDPRGGECASCSFSIESDQSAGSLIIKLRDIRGKEFTITNNDFSEVCNAIKDATYADIARLSDFR
ncbi:hypothetical protein UA45_20250 [Morganella morganii]|uniref:Uncharacterized protein n=1 Tax=Morganella morganii TaxID=582 RepID=A0A0D8L339_MORMO|nr:hypothetical protein UA45_20250 [Morganella morganii]